MYLSNPLKLVREYERLKRQRGINYLDRIFVTHVGGADEE